MKPRLFAPVAFLLLSIPAHVFAQVPNNDPATTASLPQFGAWLDDASLEGRGTTRVSVGAGWWKTPDGRQVDVPMFDISHDVSDRLHVSAFVPFYRASFGSEVTSGLDDIYLSAKVILANGSDGGVGIAVSPTLEVLNSNHSTDGRVHWALPLSAEIRPMDRIRLYGAGGYFSRGAAFGGIAAEWTAPSNSVVWVAATHSYALETGTSIRASSSRNLTALAAGLTQLLTDRLAVYAHVGRSVSHGETSTSTIGVGGGLSIRLP